MIGNISKILTNLKVEQQISKECSLSVFNHKSIPSYDELKADKYDKANISIHNIDMNIENPRLSVRFGKDGRGNSWETTIYHHYGEICNTMGADGDPLDIFLGYSCYDNNPGIYIINQYFNGKFDEHKIMFGFDNEIIAKDAYLEQYKEGWKGYHSFKKFTLDEFKQWIYSSNTLKPV